MAKRETARERNPIGIKRKLVGIRNEAVGKHQVTRLDSPVIFAVTPSSTSMDGAMMCGSFPSPLPTSSFSAASARVQRSKEALLCYAANQLRVLATRQEASRRESFVTALRPINAVTPDGASPTPQVADNGDGGIAIEWLVNGRSLVIDYSGPMEILISAVTADGTRIFDYDLIFSWHGNDEPIARSRALLAEMAAEVWVPINLA